MDTPSLNDMTQLADAELFQLMRFSTQCDFEQKLQAGIILNQRNSFDRLKMANEKKALLDHMRKLIASYDNPAAVARRVRAKALSPGLWSILFIGLFVATELHDCQTGKAFDWMGMAAFLLVGVLVMAVGLMSINSKMQKTSQMEQDHKQLLLIRIAQVEKEWTF